MTGLVSPTRAARAVRRHLRVVKSWVFRDFREGDYAPISRSHKWNEYASGENFISNNHIRPIRGCVCTFVKEFGSDLETVYEDNGLPQNIEVH